MPKGSSTMSTPTYVVGLQVPGFYFSPAAWPSKNLGRPSDESLARYVEGFEAATRPGGANAHLGETIVSSAIVRRQSDHAVIARYRRAPAPMFEIVGAFNL